MRISTGIFVTIDGPNGVDKTGVTALVCDELKKLGLNVLRTKEPTTSFNRMNEEKHGHALARLIVEDRRQHLLREIEPALDRGVLVICDRYIESSLVYRGLDGISFEDTWQENKYFRIPDMNILLTCSADILESRLKRKVSLSRFEREHTSEEESLMYVEAHQFLKTHGFRSMIVKNDCTSVEDVAGQIVSLIAQLL